MSIIEIRSSSGNYSINFGKTGIQSGIEIEFLIVDKNIRMDLRPNAHFTFEIEAIEDKKTLETVSQLIQSMADAGLNRKSTVHAVGGGVIQDISTLACSIYMRGISWVYWPTTLTGMLDSCIGGKSSINLGKHKNLIGNFYPPNEISLNTSFLETLPIAHVLSGLAEGVKICYAHSSEAFNKFLSLAPGARLAKGSSSEDLVRLCLNSKKWFVEVDEFDVKERQLLNFGHSFGHALESATDYQVPHGIAVALGILAATEFSQNEQHHLTQKLNEYCILILNLWIDTRPRAVNINWDKFSESLSADKKNSAKDLRLVLPDENAKLIIQSLPFSENSVALATAVMKNVTLRVLHEIF